MLAQPLRVGLRDKLHPSYVLDLARSMPLDQFAPREAGKAMLLVRLDEREPELLSGLIQHYGVGDSSSSQVGVLEFRTAIADIGDFDRTLSASGDELPRFDVDALARWVRAGRCFSLPIVKQGGAYLERITVGRALNKDIILRSKNVSKSHAWFERDSSGKLCIADAGSRNGTTVGGAALEARVLKPLTDGVDIRIGRIEVTVCSGELFWHLAQAV